MKRFKKIYNDFLAYSFTGISICASFYTWYYADGVMKMQYNDAILFGFLVFVFGGCALVALYEKLELK
jgi:hypothetical protein